MLFQFTSVTNPKNGKKAWAWLPKPDGNETFAEQPADLVEIQTGNNRRQIPAPLLGMAVEFLSAGHRRKSLKHDCGVFALACAMGESQRGRAFNQRGAEVVRFAYDVQPTAEEPDTETGDVVLLTQAAADAPREDFVGASPHLMVRATADEGSPLYLSKLGPEGLVVLSSFRNMTDLYSPSSVAIATDFHTVDFPQPVAS